MGQEWVRRGSGVGQGWVRGGSGEGGQGRVRGGSGVASYLPLAACLNFLQIRLQHSQHFTHIMVLGFCTVAYEQVDLGGGHINFCTVANDQVDRGVGGGGAMYGPNPMNQVNPEVNPGRARACQCWVGDMGRGSRCVRKGGTEEAA